jgi:hypothetical protein
MHSYQDFRGFRAISFRAGPVRPFRRGKYCAAPVYAELSAAQSLSPQVAVRSG